MYSHTMIYSHAHSHSDIGLCWSWISSSCLVSFIFHEKVGVYDLGDALVDGISFAMEFGMGYWWLV